VRARGDGCIYLVGGASAVIIGWRDSTTDVDLKLDPEPDGVFEAIAQVLAKVERGHRIDLLDAQAMAERGLVEPSKLMTFYETIRSDLLRYPAIDANTFRTQVEEFVRGV